MRRKRRKQKMSAIIIPIEAVESPEYATLTQPEQLFLIDLYIIMNDVERFTIDCSQPEKYRQSRGAHLPRKIKSLIDVGLLIVDGRQKSGIDHYVRVFRFRYSAASELQAAA